MLLAEALCPVCYSFSYSSFCTSNAKKNNTLVTKINSLNEEVYSFRLFI